MRRSLGAQLKSHLARAFVPMFPGRVKRIALMSILATQAKQVNMLDEATAIKLNTLMDLAGEDNAIRFFSNFYLHRMIWDGNKAVDAVALLSKQGSLPESIIDTLVAQLKESIPEWLKYGREGDLDVDLRTLLQHKAEVLG